MSALPMGGQGVVVVSGGSGASNADNSIHGATASLASAASHVTAWERARRDYRRKLNHVAALFGEPLHVALTEPLEAQEDHADDAIRHYASAVDALRGELRQQDRTIDNLRRDGAIYRRALHQAIEELDRRTKRSGKPPSDLLVSLHEIVAEPLEPF